MKLTLDRHGAPRLDEAATFERVRRLRIGAERARRTGGAVLRSLEVAEQVVVLELRGDEEQRVERQRQGIEAPESAIGPATPCHIPILRRTAAFRYSCNFWVLGN